MPYKNPVPTVDAIIQLLDHDLKIVLIKRRNPPYGWALPGGFVEYGESFEDAVVREALEETSLHFDVSHQLHTYSDPKRDPRQHIVTTAYVGFASGTPEAADDAAEVAIVDIREAIEKWNLVFDHKRILEDALSSL